MSLSEDLCDWTADDLAMISVLEQLGLLDRDEDYYLAVVNENNPIGNLAFLTLESLAQFGALEKTGPGFIYRWNSRYNRGSFYEKSLKMKKLHAIPVGASRWPPPSRNEEDAPQSVATGSKDLISGVNLCQKLSEWVTVDLAVIGVLKSLDLFECESGQFHPPVDPTSSIGDLAFLILETMWQFGAIERDTDARCRWNRAYDWDACYKRGLMEKRSYRIWNSSAGG